MKKFLNFIQKYQCTFCIGPQSNAFLRKEPLGQSTLALGTEMRLKLRPSLIADHIGQRGIIVTHRDQIYKAQLFQRRIV